MSASAVEKILHRRDTRHRDAADRLMRAVGAYIAGHRPLLNDACPRWETCACGHCSSFRAMRDALAAYLRTE